MLAGYDRGRPALLENKIYGHHRVGARSKGGNLDYSHRVRDPGLSARADEVIE